MHTVQGVDKFSLGGVQGASRAGAQGQVAQWLGSCWSTDSGTEGLSWHEAFLLPVSSQGADKRKAWAMASADSARPGRN